MFFHSEKAHGDQFFQFHNTKHLVLADVLMGYGNGLAAIHSTHYLLCHAKFLYFPIDRTAQCGL